MKDSQAYLISSRKYRPQQFQQVIGQEVCVRTLQNGIRMGKVASAYLFSGSRGTGKTTLVRIFAKALNCPNLDSKLIEPCGTCSVCKEIAEGRSLDVLEIDGASNRGIDDIRTLSETVGYAPAKGKYKIFIIDEVHMLTKEAFNALLKTLEEPPVTAKFFFATTEPHKIPETILSRCQRFNLKRLSVDAIVQKLSLIAKESGFSVEPAVISTLAQYAEGGLRDAESFFDQLIAYASDGTLNLDTVEEALGIAPRTWFEEIDRAICQGNTKASFSITDQLLLASKDVSRFLDDLYTHFRCAYLMKIHASVVDSTHRHRELSTMNDLVSLLQEEQIQKAFSYILEAMKAMKTAASPRCILEKLLLDIITIRYEIPLPYIVKKLASLEQTFQTVEQEPARERTAPSVHNGICPIEPPQQPCVRVNPASFQTKNEEQEKQRQATIMNFAAIELEGTLVKKTRQQNN